MNVQPALTLPLLLQVNGQFNNGVFQEGWGFIGADGNFYSLENDDIIQNWDADMYGYELPDGWDQYLGQGEQESCSYESAGSCYNQFVACMQILGEDEYEDYAQEVAEEVYGDMYEMYERNQATLQDFMECTEIDFDGDYEGDDKQQDEQQGQNNGGYYNGNWQANGNANYEQYKNDDGDYSFYVGPHCDGDKITLAVYTDEYCSNYASGVDIEDILGYDPMQGMDGEEFELVPTDCISCAYDEVGSRRILRPRLFTTSYLLCFSSSPTSRTSLGMRVRKSTARKMVSTPCARSSTNSLASATRTSSPRRSTATPSTTSRTAARSTRTGCKCTSRRTSTSTRTLSAPTSTRSSSTPTTSMVK